MPVVLSPIQQPVLQMRVRTRPALLAEGLWGCQCVGDASGGVHVTTSHPLLVVAASGRQSGLLAICQIALPESLDVLHGFELQSGSHGGQIRSVETREANDDAE
jgi:hypothetical protein